MLWDCTLIAPIRAVDSTSERTIPGAIVQNIAASCVEVTGLSGSSAMIAACPGSISVAIFSEFDNALNLEMFLKLRICNSQVLNIMFQRMLLTIP